MDSPQQASEDTFPNPDGLASLNSGTSCVHISAASVMADDGLSCARSGLPPECCRDGDRLGERDFPQWRHSGTRQVKGAYIVLPWR